MKSKEGKLETSKPMAQMRQVAYGREMTQTLLKMELHQAERNDDAIMRKAEEKRLRKAEKARKANGNAVLINTTTGVQDAAK